VLAYLAWNGALSAAFQDVIVFTMTRYSASAVVPFGLWASFTLKYLYPLATGLAILTCILARHSFLKDRVLRTCIAFGLAGFIGSFPRPDQFHLSVTAPLVAPLLAYCLRQLTEPLLPLYRYAVLAVAIAFFAPATYAFKAQSWPARHGMITPTPRGGAIFALFGAPRLVARIAAAPSRDKYFFYPFEPMLAFLTGRAQVSKYDGLMPGYSTPLQYQEACSSVMREADWVVLDHGISKNIKILFPNLRDPEPPERTKFEQALRTGFDFVTQDGGFELRHRTPAADDSLCSGIAD